MAEQARSDCPGADAAQNAQSWNDQPRHDLPCSEQPWSERLRLTASQLEHLLTALFAEAEERAALEGFGAPADLLRQRHGLDAGVAERLRLLLPGLFLPARPPAEVALAGREAAGVDAEPANFIVAEPADPDPETRGTLPLLLGASFNREQMRRARALWQPLLASFQQALPWIERFEVMHTTGGLIGRGPGPLRLIACAGSGSDSSGSLPHYLALRAGEAEGSPCPAAAWRSNGAFELSFHGDGERRYGQALRSILRSLGARIQDPRLQQTTQLQTTKLQPTKLQTTQHQTPKPEKRQQEP